jgi:hypothetical protein
MLFQKSANPLQVWQYAERYLCAGSRQYSSFSHETSVTPNYQPCGATPSYFLCSFWLENVLGEYHVNVPGSDLHELYGEPGRFIFLVHPDVLSMSDVHLRRYLDRCKPGPTVEVIPSASSRTVFVEKINGKRVRAHFVKLHYPRRISRFSRPLYISDLRLQFWVTNRLAKTGIPILPDVGGGMLGSDPDLGWGYMVRDIPEATVGPRTFTFPLFSLYGRDIHAPNDPTLLEQLLVGRDAFGAIVELITGIISLYIKAVLEGGCLVEPHGQNILVKFSADDNSWTVLYRDGGIYVDGSRLSDLTNRPSDDVIGRDTDLAIDQVLSLTYDSFLGHHALSYLNRAASESIGISENALREEAKRIFHELGGSQLNLPPSIFYFDDKLYDGEEFTLIDTRMKPTWR